MGFASAELLQLCASEEITDANAFDGLTLLSHRNIKLEKEIV